MSRVPWDDLPGSCLARNEKSVLDTQTTLPVEESKVRNYWNEADAIGRRIAFGAICGALTGASFGFVDVLRDTKALTSKSSVSRAKILRFTLYFGGFFAVYQGTRKLLKYNVKQSGEENLATAAAVTLLPMLFVPTLRPLIPYGIFLIAVDSINGVNDI